MKRAIGFEFYENWIYCLEVLFEKGRVQVVDFDRIKLSEEIVQNNELKDLELLSKQIHPRWFKKSFLRAIPVIVGISGLHAFIRKLVIPAVPAKEVEKIIHWEGETILPYPINEVIYRYQVLRESVVDYQVLFTAILQSKLASYLQLFQKLKLPVRLLSLHPFGMVNYLEYLDELKGYDGLLLRMGEEQCDLVLIYQGEVELVRTINLVNNNQQVSLELLIKELVSTLEHFQTLKDIWLNSGIFFGSHQILENLRIQMSTFHWRHIFVDSSFFRKTAGVPVHIAEQLPSILGLTLLGVTR